MPCGRLGQLPALHRGSSQRCVCVFIHITGDGMTGKTAPMRKRPVPRLPAPTLISAARLAWEPDIAGRYRAIGSLTCEALRPHLEKEHLSLRLIGNAVELYERRPGAVMTARSDRGLAGSFVRYIDRLGFLSPSAAVVEAVTERAQRQLNDAIVKARDTPEVDYCEAEADERLTIIKKHWLLCHLLGVDPAAYTWNGVGIMPKRNR
jgi:hypothetical protein